MLSTAFSMSSIVTLSLAITIAFSVARFTETYLTPSIFFIALSTFLTQDAHVIPCTLKLISFSCDKDRELFMDVSVDDFILRHLCI